MKDKRTEREAAERAPKLSGDDAARILSNVFKACGIQPNKVPLKELEKRVRYMEQTGECLQ